MSVYLCVCLSARISPELHVRSLPNFWCMLPTVVTRSSSGGWGEVCYLNTQVYGCHHTSDADTLQYSLSTATFRVRQTGQPSYLFDETEEYRPTRVSRSASAPLLQRPHANTALSSRVFSAAAPAVWNSLDINTRSAETFLIFRRKLKTALFVKSYDT